MSELVAHKADVTIPVYGTIADAEVYLKYEADKVIEELELQLAKAQLVLRLNEPKPLYSNLEIMSRLNHKIYVVERRELHQKYKRCLAMAMWCDSEANYWYDSSKVQQCCRYGHYISWFNKWSKLAEKFKEAK